LCLKAWLDEKISNKIHLPGEKWKAQHPQPVQIREAFR